MRGVRFKRDNRIIGTVRGTRHEHAWIVRAAEREGLSIAEWLRWCLGLGTRAVPRSVRTELGDEVPIPRALYRALARYCTADGSEDDFEAVIGALDRAWQEYVAARNQARRSDCDETRDETGQRRDEPAGLRNEPGPE